VQFQESLPITQPGQTTEDLLDDNYVNVADYDSNTNTVSLSEQKRPTNWKQDYTIQQFNFKSKNKPFICFEPGSRLTVRWIGGGYNHFPVNQARSDGRWAKTLDRPTHIVSSPCSHPPVHENGDRLSWFALYGMNSMKMDELISFGRSWAYAPDISLKGDDYIFSEYDRSERCYRLESKNEKTEELEFSLDGSSDKPVYNPAFLIENWNASSAKVLVNGKPAKDVRTGINHELEGDNLVVFLFLEKNESVNITIQPE